MDSPLSATFYARPVVTVARDLLGCVVRHGDTAGVIVETEAYHDSEPACHAFVGVTARTHTLFGPPGRVYLYRSYGIHALLNAVCEPEGVGAAVLIRALEPLVRMCPTVADYPYLLGVALIQAEDMVAAVTPLEEAARLEPRRVLTLVALGLALNGSKRHADAKAQLVSALELEPDNVEGVAALAEAEEGLGEDQAAEAHALRALERSPGHITANMVLGMVRLKQERYAEAREPLERAAGAEFTSAKAHYQLSLAYARLGDTAGARRQIEIYQQKQKETEDRLRRLRLGPGEKCVMDRDRAGKRHHAQPEPAALEQVWSRAVRHGASPAPCSRR